jgi:hypothetical protein
MLYLIAWCHYLRHYHHRHRRLLPVEREEIFYLLIYKVNFTLETSKKAQRVVDVQIYSIFSLGARRGGCLRPCLCLFTPGSDPVPTAWETETYTHIRSSNWFGRGGTRLKFVYALWCVVCDVCALCSDEPTLNYCQGNTGFKFQLGVRDSLRALFISSATFCSSSEKSQNFVISRVLWNRCN